MDRKNKNSRVDIAAWTAIIIGLVLGFMLKRVKFGLIIGLVIGIAVVYMWSRRRK
jgi:F0F1-type ATP synthase assembly protein I